MSGESSQMQQVIRSEAAVGCGVVLAVANLSSVRCLLSEFGDACRVRLNVDMSSAVSVVLAEDLNILKRSATLRPHDSRCAP